MEDRRQNAQCSKSKVFVGDPETTGFGSRERLQILIRAVKTNTFNIAYFTHFVKAHTNLDDRLRSQPLTRINVTKMCEFVAYITKRCLT